jgi:hypothetical protein
MDFTLPTRLLRQFNGDFPVVDARSDNVQEFDIISYTWGRSKTNTALKYLACTRTWS